MRLIYSFNPSDPEPMQKHTIKGSKSVQLLSPPREEPTLPDDAFSYDFINTEVNAFLKTKQRNNVQLHLPMFLWTNYHCHTACVFKVHSHYDFILWTYTLCRRNSKVFIYQFSNFTYLNVVCTEAVMTQWPIVGNQLANKLD